MGKASTGNRTEGSKKDEAGSDLGRNEETIDWHRGHSQKEAKSKPTNKQAKFVSATK
jgi:hypothetical protein